MGHGTRVHEPSLRIPLLLLVPGEQGRADGRLFQPVDVPATILGALGIAIPDDWVGRDMLAATELGRRFVVALGTLSDGQAAVIDAAGEKVVRPGPDAAPLAFDLTRDPAEENGAPPAAPARAVASARIAAYEQLAARGWERRRRGAGEPLSFDGRALAARWAPGPCVTTQLTAAGDLRVEPRGGGICAHGADPFERRLGRAFAAEALAGGFDLRLTIDLDGGAADPARTPPRVLVKQWGSDQTIALPLEPHANGFQSVTGSLPPPGASGDTMLAVVGVDPPAPYVLRELAIEPRP
jgi:hypothetical protein